MRWTVTIKGAGETHTKTFEDGGWSGDPSNMDVYHYIDKIIRDLVSFRDTDKGIVHVTIKAETL